MEKIESQDKIKKLNNDKTEEQLNIKIKLDTDMNDILEMVLNLNKNIKKEKKNKIKNKIVYIFENLPKSQLKKLSNIISFINIDETIKYNIINNCNLILEDKKIDYNDINYILDLIYNLSNIFDKDSDIKIQMDPEVIYTAIKIITLMFIISDIDDENNEYYKYIMNVIDKGMLLLSKVIDFKKKCTFGLCCC
jgi:hypothetical protein